MKGKFHHKTSSIQRRDITTYAPMKSSVQVIAYEQVVMNQEEGIPCHCVVAHTLDKL